MLLLRDFLVDLLPYTDRDGVVLPVLNPNSMSGTLCNRLGGDCAFVSEIHDLGKVDETIQTQLKDQYPVTASFHVVMHYDRK